jgi:hypothetical protein
MGAQPGPCIPCGTTIDCDPRNLCGSAECQIAPGDTGGVCVPKAQLVCDDGNACNGLETCDPQTGCQPGVPPACDDGDACNGVETCDPQTGCVRGTPPVCDDGDSCTTDACDPKAGCTNTPLPGFALAFCRVDAARVIVSGAAPGDIAAPIRAKLLKALGVVDGKLQVGQGNPKKLKKAVGAARKQAAHVVAFVTKQRGKKIADPTAQQILEALGVLRPILDGLVP